MQALAVSLLIIICLSARLSVCLAVTCCYCVKASQAVIIIIISLFWKHRQSENTEKQYEQ